MKENPFNQTIEFKNKPKIIGNYSVAGPKEGKGHFGKFFHYVMESDNFGEATYEKAEKKMMEKVLKGAINSAGLKPENINLFLAGDLLNQIISSSYAARSFDIPYLGLFGACSTMAESLALGACIIDGKFFETVACATVSHFSTAERQFRYPLELGNQRPPTSQWTVTASGCSILSLNGSGPVITKATFGKVTDYGITDVNNMGAAMAPSTMSTMIAHFKDTGTKPDDFDLIITGDLGKIGSEILIDLMEDKGFKLGVNYCDCGQMIYKSEQNPLMGGSGCGCSASLINSYFMEKLKKNKVKKILYLATGALLSTTAIQQGETVPGITHAVLIESGK